jgi:hypothetical protein
MSGVSLRTLESVPSEHESITSRAVIAPDAEVIDYLGELIDPCGEWIDQLPGRDRYSGAMFSKAFAEDGQGVPARRVQGLLVFLVALDVVLTTWAMAFPGLWFWAFHGTAYDDPQGFLRRCGANWAAFLLWQVVALVRWRREPVWLAVVAGVRLSDIFTDVTYSFVAHDTTLFAKLTLAPMSALNLLFGLFLLRAYQWRVGITAPR